MAENGIVLRRQNFALVGSGFRGLDRGLVGQIGEKSGLAHIGQLCRTFGDTQKGHKAGGVLQGHKPIESGIELFAHGMGQPIGIIFNADLPLDTQTFQHPAQILCRIGIGGILPDANVLDI